MWTPWGQSDSEKTIADGIIEVSTPSHGGIYLDDERIKQLPKDITNFTKNLHWWEEDCDWVVPYIVFRKDIRKSGKAYHFEENLAIAIETAQRSYPSILNF